MILLHPAKLQTTEIFRWIHYVGILSLAVAVVIVGDVYLRENDDYYYVAMVEAEHGLPERRKKKKKERQRNVTFF